MKKFILFALFLFVVGCSAGGAEEPKELYPCKKTSDCPPSLLRACVDGLCAG
ncbi:hypothetical protein JYT19_00930 [Sulfobacillus acidophilus]|uniref:Lipoprotein n=1 Tax=Sulfobacillus acidophilus TaxID=53633 RepID=A0ABS3AWH0_9FIRM|nr:hypothetical protein [Sulfobacillus acidophilus]